MDISVVIPTHDQKERLRLVLCGLKQQTLATDRFEILVVDDGCTDGTREMLGGIDLPNLGVLAQTPRQGRNQARNRGIRAAEGELIVFLDGDALPAPDLLERYWATYQQHGDRIVFCGFQHSLPDLEYFQDPQTGALMELPVPSVMQDYIAAHLGEMVVTEEMVRGDFAAVRARAQEGGYPFAELKQLQDQILEVFLLRPAAAVRWVGFYPHNGAIPRFLLQKEGGFDEGIPFSEGWELAYRLQNSHRVEIFPVQADSYHLYHYHGFADPEAAVGEVRMRYDAIEYMVDKHQDSRIRLLYFWYAHLWPDSFIPEEALVEDLVSFDRLYRELPEEEWEEYQIVLHHHPTISPLLNLEVSYEDCA